MRIIKCRKVKFGAYQGGRSVFLSFDWTFESFLSYVNPIHDSLQVISYVLKLDETIKASHMAISGRGKREGEKA